MWLRHMPTLPRRCPNRARAPIARSVCHWQSSRESFLNASNAGRQVQHSEGNGRASLKPVPVLSGPVCIKRSPLSDRSNGQKAMSCELSPSIPRSPLRRCATAPGDCAVPGRYATALWRAANPGNSRVADSRGEPLEQQQIERAVE
jgi:hypothetical protein